MPSLPQAIRLAVSLARRLTVQAASLRALLQRAPPIRAQAAPLVQQAQVVAPRRPLRVGRRAARLVTLDPN